MGVVNRTFLKKIYFLAKEFFQSKFKIKIEHYELAVTSNKYC